MMSGSTRATIAKPAERLPVPMTKLALAAAVLAVLIAVFLSRKLGRVRRELEEAEARLGRRLFRVQGRLAELESKVSELEFERRRTRGEIRFDARTKLADAIAVHPRVLEILGSFGISGGGCGGGSLDESGSIQEACRAASVDPADVLDALRRFVDDPDGKLGAPEAAQAKLHQIGRLPSAP
jgi:hypothetical protein